MIATITPTRGDRPELLEFCKHQLSRMTVKPEKSYFIDYKPESDERERVREGVEMAKADGFDTVFIIEEGDAYPADYFQRFDLEQYCFWGAYKTTYYVLKNRRYFEFTHPDRSSLFTTGFKISVLEGFAWRPPEARPLDVTLWEFAVNNALRRQLLSKAGTLDIKHNLGEGITFSGLYSGYIDNSLTWLRGVTDREQFDFYRELTKRL